MKSLDASDTVTKLIVSRLNDWIDERRTGHLDFQINFFQGGITTFKDGHEQTLKFN